MTRATIAVRRVDEQLHDAVLELWTNHRVETGASRDAVARLAADGAVRAALSKPDVSAYVAFSEQRPVGYVVCTYRVLGPFCEKACVVIDQLYVAREARRSGVARLLMAAVAAHAERAGSEQVVTHVPASGREANRFFARLGFLPSIVRRVTSTASLQRRLVPDIKAGMLVRETSAKVLARRRTARFRRWQQEGLPTT